MLRSQPCRSFIALRLLPGRATSNDELQQYAHEPTNGKTDRDIEQEITNLPE